MSKIPRLPRETIVLLGAIVGANLIAFVTHSPSVQSLDCFQSFFPKDDRPRLPASDIPLDQRGRKEGYYDVRLKKDVTIPDQPAPATHSYLPLQQPAAAATVRTEGTTVSTRIPPSTAAAAAAAVDAALDATIAREHGLTLQQYHDSLASGGVY